MNKYDYINELMKQLDGLPNNEIDKAVEFYTNYFNDAYDHNQSDEKIIEKLGSPEAVALRIRAAYEVEAAKGQRRGGNRLGFSVIAVILALVCSAVTFLLVINFAVIPAEETYAISETGISETAVPYLESPVQDTAQPEAPEPIAVESSDNPGIIFSAGDIGDAGLYLEETIDLSGYDMATISIGRTQGYTHEPPVPELKTKTLIFGADVDSISIDILNDNISVVSGGDAVTLTFVDRFGLDYDIFKNGSNLVFMKSDAYNNWSGQYKISHPDAPELAAQTIVLTIPEGLSLETLKIAGINIQIDINGIEATDLSLNSITDRTTISGCKFNTVNAYSMNSKFTMDKSEFERFSIYSANLRIALNDLANFNDYNYTLYGTGTRLDFGGEIITNSDRILERTSGYTGAKSIRIEGTSWSASLYE